MLSILIPSYNHSSFVEEAIDSARSIDISGKRIVIIDDASSDGSADVIANNLKRNGADGIEFIRKPVNLGAIDSVNRFLSGCNTRYVYFMASDDVAVARGIEALINRLESNHTLQFAIGGGVNLLPDGTTYPLYGRNQDRFFALPPHKLREAVFLDYPSPILCQSSVFRLDAIRAVGGFDPNIIADDYALFARLFTHYFHPVQDFEFLPELHCVRYRHHAINSHRNVARQAIATRQVISAFAPAVLRARAAGGMLAYYALVAVKRGDIGALRGVLKLLPSKELPWFLGGLVSHSIKQLRAR